ncbi:uncharacterized protein LOC129305201 [Prosopis cineraria]|uniref:uncharacterized protein LOC129305201 n=1 Tax=Prosopis cineraria TaxID=364024 RepID=UPI00240EBFCC|nr:uncharacterized protein LOC129305201 [Prosopis cineraria]
MPSEQVRLSQSAASDAEKHKQLDREIREMVSTITHRVTDLHKSSGSGSGQNLEDDEDGGVRIITLAGNNTGATLRSALDEKSAQSHGSEEPEALSTYVNSNFQAINNSMMLGGSYEANDPGVRLDISEFIEPRSKHREKKHRKKEKKEKKKENKGSGSGSGSTTDHSD